MPKKVITTKAGQMVQWTVYIPEPIYRAFEERAAKEFKRPPEAVRDALRQYAEKK
jgi:metal-responsive CopG/Arc/MetJ family transcriptional regulator